MTHEHNNDYLSLFEQVKNKIPSGRPLVWRVVLAVAAIALLAGLIIIFLTRGEEAGPPGQGPGIAQGPVPVRVGQAQTGRLDIFYRSLGTIVPLHTVTVRTQVDGQLLALYFEEGQMVKQGDLLAEIDPRPYQAQLVQAEGQLLRDQAQLTSALQDLERYRVLIKQQSIAAQQWDTQKALVEQYRGTVKYDQGQIDYIKVQLSYCRITSPIGGRTGLRLVDPGNIVKASDANGLVVVSQLAPIQAVFTITDSQVPDFLTAVAANPALPVQVWDKDQKKLLAQGRLVSYDNQIDPSTGTLKLKAEFANQDNNLFPNQFVNIRLQVKTLADVLIVPAAAVQYGSQGPYVYTVDQDKKVSLRQVVPGPEESGQVVIESGLTEGDVVVTEGVDRLREGSQVEF